MKRIFWTLAAGVIWLAGTSAGFGQSSTSGRPASNNYSAPYLAAAPAARPAPQPAAPSAALALPAPPATDGTSCAAGCAEACAPLCDKCCFCDWQVFGEFLYLRPRNTDVEYATPFNGPITRGAVPIQIGRPGIVDADYQPAFRLGFARALDECASLGVTYTRFESETNDSVEADPNTTFLLRSMVMHPSTFDAAADYTKASARQDLDFSLVDVDYRHIFLHNGRYCVNYLVGFRYAHLDQNFHSLFASEVQEQVDTKINFDGGGIRVGLEAERHAECSGLFVYGKSAASFVGGEFHANYFQRSDQDPRIVDTEWAAGRLVSMLDLEVGAGWTNCKGNWRISGGYMVSGWYNVVKTADYIRSVQTNNYQGVGLATDNSLTFDGFVTRVEYRW